MVFKRKNKAHKTNGRRGKRYRKSREGRQQINRIITKTRTKLKPVRTRSERPLAPILVSVLPLSSTADCKRVRSLILESCRDPKSGTMEEDSGGLETVTLPAKKHKWTLFPLLTSTDPLELVHSVFATEFVLFVLDDNASFESPIDATGASLLKLFKSCGLCSFAIILQSTDASFKKKMKKDFVNQFGNDVKVVSICDKEDCVLFLNQLPDSLLVPCWRQERPFLIPESISSQSSNPCNGNLMTLRGFLRSTPLSINQIISIPALGYFQIHQMEDLETGRVLIGETGVQQEILVENNNPPEAPIKEQELPEEVIRELKTVPKGTSEYQATWIADVSSSSDISVHQGSDFEDNESPLEDSNDSICSKSEDEVSLSEDMEVEESSNNQQRLIDEINTPSEKPARIRFQNYRGLKSFRTSPWDAKNDLPEAYSRIFEFENFVNAMKQAKKEICNFQDDSMVSAGSRIALTLKGVDPDQIQSIELRMNGFLQGTEAPLMLIGLMRDETKMSVQHYRVIKHPDYQPAITNKEKFLLVSPLHSFYALPLLSTDDPQFDKHKMEKTLRPQCHTIASTYGPITFPPMPILGFKTQETDHGAQLAFTGTLQSCAPDRVILKHIILTGRPTQTRKKRAVVKGMFHDPDDVRWFKPLELWTKCGRIGYIKESLGTKGLMKCHFDGNIQHHDTVCISLYKRVYPVWLK